MQAQNEDMMLISYSLLFLFLNAALRAEIVALQDWLLLVHLSGVHFIAGDKVQIYVETFSNKTPGRSKVQLLQSAAPP
jgi:hypothetical protein